MALPSTSYYCEIRIAKWGNHREVSLEAISIR